MQIIWQFFLFFLFKNALWHPHRDNLNEMLQCIVKLKGTEVSQIYIRYTFLPESLLCCANVNVLKNKYWRAYLLADLLTGLSCFVLFCNLK